MPLFRLRYTGPATTWGFAIYRASHDDYKNSYLPSGHWSSRLLATRLGISNGTVARAWRDYGVQPWRSETSLVSGQTGF